MDIRKMAVSVAALALTASACGASSSSGSGSSDDTTIKIYTGRHYDLEQAFSQFTEDTGIEIEYLTGTDAELREKLETEGDNTEADIFMTVDAANLALAAKEDMFQPLESETLTTAIPEQYRNADNSWFGLSLRARTIVYNGEALTPEEAPSSYAELAEPEWDGRVCLRQSTSTYTQSLIASLIANEGRDRAVEIVQGWTDNAEILDNDIKILESIDQGKCDVGITNHYYLARKIEENPDFGVKLVWAEPEGTGTHINISGAGVTKNADNPEAAQQLLEYLATDGQNLFVDGNHEFPANEEIPVVELVEENFGSDFNRDQLNAQEFGDLNSEALAIMDEVGYR